METSPLQSASILHLSNNTFDRLTTFSGPVRVRGCVGAKEGGVGAEGSVLGAKGGGLISDIRDIDFCHCACKISSAEGAGVAVTFTGVSGGYKSGPSSVSISLGSKGSSDSSGSTPRIPCVELGVSSYAGLNVSKDCSSVCSCFCENGGGAADACKTVSAGFRAFKPEYTVFQVIMISSGTSNRKSFFICNSPPQLCPQQAII